MYLAIKGIESVKNSGPITVGTFFGDKIFRNIVVSLVATYGIYILASILALDPWHMRKSTSSWLQSVRGACTGKKFMGVTSFAQYLFLAPSYINVLK